MSVDGYSRPVVAFGPRIPEAGSWEWLGQDMATALQEKFETVVFDRDVPPCDVAVFIKFKPPRESLRKIAAPSAVVYCPVDVYGSAAEIDADEDLLLCDRIVVHCPKLAKYTRSYAQTVCLDHHLKFTVPIREQFVPEGSLLWVGVRTNLPPLADWLRKTSFEEELWILTNPEDSKDLENPERLGLPPDGSYKLGEWTVERHREWLKRCRAVLDVKGQDFRARHKPAAKAMDVVASGVPLAMNRDSSPAEYLRQLGFEVACPEDRDRWISREYWEETRAFGRQLHERFSLPVLRDAWENLLDDVLSEKRRLHSRQDVSTVSGPPAAPTIPNRLPRKTRVALVSMLFNWPSTGGGTIHTYETAKFLERAGYAVRHFYVQSEAWDVGNVEEPLGYPAEPVTWEPTTGGLAHLQQKVREVIEIFAPDEVFLTDSWTMKPRLAEAVRSYKFFLRLAAQECLCPLNNVRMLVDESGQVTRCPRHQLATPEICRDCVAGRQQFFGLLHQRERELSGYGTDDYDRALRFAFAEAEAVLVVNPLIEAMVSPFARQTRVVPSGFDSGGFPGRGRTA